MLLYILGSLLAIWCGISLCGWLLVRLGVGSWD